MTASVNPVAPKKRSWIKWIALGCVGILILGALAAAALVLVIFGAVKRSDVYAGALARARAHPGVVAALGEPIEPGFFVSGSVNVTGPSGEASLAIPLKGPKGKGKLYVEATKGAGEWQYQTLAFEPEGGGARIDLLAESAQSEPPGDAAPASAEGGSPAAAGAPALDRIGFAMDDDSAEVREFLERFPSGVKAVLAGVHFTNVKREDEIVQRWYRDGEKIDEQLLAASDLWEGALPPEGWFSLRLAAEDGLASGEYRVDVWLNGTRAQSGTFVIE